ncbi:hypothetical protein ACUOFC_55720, partial [Escherichia sp. TWPC-MK]
SPVHENGKTPATCGAAHVYASLHRVQQFRFFGIPGRQAYRELRLLAGQAARQQGDKKAGAPVLDDPRLDAILAAAAGVYHIFHIQRVSVFVHQF